MRAGRPQTGTNLYRYEIFCSRLHADRDEMLGRLHETPVRTQRQQIFKLYNLHNSII